MEDLISRNTLIEAILDARRIDTETIPKLIRLIDAQPTIEPKRGRWIPLRKEGCYKCSECLAASRVDNAGIPSLYWNYCPRCGERMEG